MKDTNIQYYEEVSKLLAQIMETEQESINKAAELVANAIQADKLFHVVGTGGHSNMVSIEMCHRAGNLIPCNVILDPGLGCEHGATRWCEKVKGYTPNVLRYYGVKKGDVVLQFNAYGINQSSIDAAHYLKELGATVIAVTSPDLSKSIPADFGGRSDWKENLCDLADIVINSYTPFGEAVVSLEGYPFKVSPASTIANLFIMNMINAKVCEILANRGITPPVWISGNIPGGTETNQAAMDKYKGILRHI